MSDDHMCAICQAPLRELLDHTSLECGHTYHTYCIATYCETTSQSLSNIACPVCKRTAAQIRSLSGILPDDTDSTQRLPGANNLDLEIPNAQSHTADVPDYPTVADHTSSLESDLEMLSPLFVSESATPATPNASPVAPQPSPAASDASTVAPSFPASDMPLANRPQYASLDVCCGTCGSNVHVSRARCRSKMKQTWVCNKCEVQISQLRRGFGSWPVPGFNKISKEDQQAFFRDAKEMGGQDFVKKAEEMLNISEDIEAQYYQSGGKFLPINVWTIKGYDAVAIKAKSAPEDIREHPVLGTTYRLKIIELGDRGEKKSVAPNLDS